MEEGEMSAAAEKEEEMSGEAGKEGKGKPDGEPDGEQGVKVLVFSFLFSI